MPTKTTLKAMEYAYGVLFSVNIAAALMWARSATADFRLLQRAKRLFPPHFRYSDNYASGYPAFILLTAVFAICLLVFLLLGRRWLLKPLGLQLTGIVSLLIVPGAWWYIENILGPFRTSPLWFPIEGLVVAICAFLYMHSRFSTHLLLLYCLLLVAHFSLWTWILQQYFLGNSFGFMFPIVAFLSSLSWGMYVFKSAERDPNLSAKELPA